MENIYWQLIAKKLSGNATEEEANQLELWIQESPENALLYRQTIEIWNNIKREPEIIPDVNRSWKGMRKKLLSLEPIIPFITVSRHGFQRWLVAASVLFLIFTSFFLFKTRPQYQELKTGNEIGIFYLPDSSKIWLNKNSVIKYSKKFDKERIVYLQGEAFFDIKRDTTRPFIINTPTTITRVLGTSFNLKAYNDGTTELVVVKGLVSFSSNTNASGKVLLKKGDKGICSKDGKDVLGKKNDESNFLAWMQNDNNEGIEEIMHEESEKASSYLYSSFDWKENILRQTIIEGRVDNSSVFTSYKDIQLRVIYFDYKDEKLAEEVFLLNETISPGLSLSFKHKLKTKIKRIKRVRLEIINAKSVESKDFAVKK